MPVDPLALVAARGFLVKQVGADSSVPGGGEKTLLRWGLSAEENRELIRAGVDLHAVDGQGRNALAHQALPPAHVIGYCKPDVAALQVLLDAGLAPPDAVTAQRWKSVAHQHATSALESSEASAFGEWLDRICAPNAEADPAAPSMTLAELLATRKRPEMAKAEESRVSQR